MDPDQHHVRDRFRADELLWAADDAQLQEAVGNLLILAGVERVELLQAEEGDLCRGKKTIPREQTQEKQAEVRGSSRDTKTRVCARWGERALGCGRGVKGFKGSVSPEYEEGDMRTISRQAFFRFMMPVRILEWGQSEDGSWLHKICHCPWASWNVTVHKELACLGSKYKKS